MYGCMYIHITFIFTRINLNVQLVGMLKRLFHLGELSLRTIFLFSSICIKKGNNFHAYIFGKPSNPTFSNCFRLLQTHSRFAFFGFQLLTLLGATLKIS